MANVPSAAIQPPSARMSVDSEVKQQGCASVFPRRESRPGDAADRPRKQEGAGKAGRWPRPWPACKKVSRRQSPQVWPESPGLPRAMVLRLIRDLPGARALLPPSPARSSLADLTPASGCQDHTISSSASVPFVRASKSRASPKRPSHPALNVRDDREAPLVASTGQADHSSDFWKRQADFHKSENRPGATKRHEGQFAHGGHACRNSIGWAKALGPCPPFLHTWVA